MFYAIQYAYGKHVVNNGNQSDYVFGFSTKAERDEWVKNRATEYYTDSNYRDAVKANDKQVRKAKNQVEQYSHVYNWSDGVPV